jgi:hypothetical protein
MKFVSTNLIENYTLSIVFTWALTDHLTPYRSVFPQNLLVIQVFKKFSIYIKH